MDDPPRGILLAVGLVLTAGFLGLAVLGWGDLASFLQHPARVAACIASVLMMVVSARSDVNLSTGKREDAGNRWIFLPAIPMIVLAAWLPAFSDRRDLLTIDGDGVRYLGLSLFVGGGVLRIWPMFVLGRRFSGLVAIQPHHELLTEGLYRRIRNPSYLGGLVNLVGWALLFRSALGLLTLAPALWITVARIDAEEALLASEFGEAYAAYRRRSWRLVPWIY
jgi:protein-S-isoprenylcysteine O-methyltransferase Ste14